MRKSEPLDLTPNGKASKFFSYREAWTRIKLAQEHGFYFEAVTIQESIISDRLISYFRDLDIILKREFFGDLTAKWKESPAIQHKHIDNLQETVDLWRKNRNRIVHRIVKVEVDSEVYAIDNFLLSAQAVAEEGTVLARAVCDWHRKVTYTKIH